jgi:hypothetical protein
MTPTQCVNVPPFYVATMNGFLAMEGHRPYNVADCRLATPFDTFEEADAAGRASAWRLSPAGTSYFAILCLPEGTY